MFSTHYSLLLICGSVITDTSHISFRELYSLYRYMSSVFTENLSLRLSVCLSSQTLAGLEFVQQCLKFDWDVRLFLTKRSAINTELSRTV